MYKLQFSQISNKVVSVLRVEDSTSIPFDPANTDYQAFKTDLANGVVLNDAEGNPITGSALTTFIGTLP
jgi:hypothetical protein